MTIAWQPDTREWHLGNGQLSWVLAVLENGWIGQVHAGAPLAHGPSYRHLAGVPFDGYDNRLGESVPLALPVPGVGDYRVPGLVVRQADGSTVLDLQYMGHRIIAGKPSFADPLPSSYVESDAEADTLEIDIKDDRSGVVATLVYTLFADRPVVARHLRITNTGAAPVDLTCAMSATLDLPDASWTLLHLSGTWARERAVVERPIMPGHQGLGSTRGASSHQHNPFVALRRPSTTEEAGEAWGAALVYSGNFTAEVEVDSMATARLRLGIHPDGFEWRLEPGASFSTPEAVFAWSADGLDGLSDTLHRLFRERVARGPWRDADRPILLNSWEGAYFDFDHRRLVGMATAAAAVGIELFVLDDGWFGVRDDDRSSLGDWVVDRRKLPDGIDGLARDVHGLGLKFGLWFEPEMVSPDSDLFRAHPDWAIGVPGRRRTQGRWQYVLDLGRPEVVDHLAEAVGDVIAHGSLDYVKWDWNRTITEAGTSGLPTGRQDELQHRYILGLYDLLGRLTRRFPDVLFESCAGGGGRFDAGMLAFAPQAWTSDDTDAVERLKIQWGSSLAYPLSSISAHVSAVPNHQTGRVTPLAFRAAVAMFGAFGYELDQSALRAEELEEVASQVTFYGDRRHLFQRGRFVRLRSPFDGDGNDTAWMVLDRDGSRAVAAHYRVLNRPIPVRDRLRLRHLDPEARYEITTWDGFDRPTGTAIRGGDELLTVGLGIDPPDPPPPTAAHAGPVPVGADFRARVYDFRRL